MYCPNCGKEVDEKDNFCKNCSSTLKAKSKKINFNKKYTKYFVVGFSLICIFIALYFVILNNSKPKNFDLSVFAIGENLDDFMEANKGGKLTEEKEEEYYKWILNKEYVINREINDFKAVCTYIGFRDFNDKSKYPISYTSIEFNEINNNRKAKKLYESLKYTIEEHYGIKLDEKINTSKINANLETYACDYIDDNYSEDINLLITLYLSPTDSNPNLYRVFVIISE